MRGLLEEVSSAALADWWEATLNSLGMRQKVLEHKAVEKWDEVVGPQVAASAGG